MPGDFNEEVVRAYFEQQGFFVRMNVPCRFAEARADSSDVDIVAVHPIENRCISCEVKGWHTVTMTMGWWKDWPLLNFTSAAADRAVRELVGELPIDHVLVVPPVSERHRAAIEHHATSHGVTLLEWPRLLADLVHRVDLVKHSRDQTTHVLRVLRVHGLIRLPGDA